MDWADLCDTIFYDFLAGEVGLVANKQLIHTLRSVAVDFLQPLLHVGECICESVGEGVADGQSQRALTVVSHIIDDNNAVCSTVVRRGDSTETFLS
jgi:hypothetical protein